MPLNRTPQRLTLVVHALNSGGAERAAAILANQWARQDKQVTLVTLDSLETDEYDLDAEVTRTALGLMGHSRGLLQAIRNNWWRLTSLRAAIRASRPDAIIAITDKINVLSVLASRGLKAELFLAERIDFRRHQIGPVWSWLRRLTYRRCTGLVVLTKRLQEPGRKLARGRPVFVIPNGIEPFPHAETNGENDGGRQRIVIAMGRLVEQKAFDHLIRAFAQIARECPEWTVRILGDGPLRPDLERLIESEGMQDRICLAGRSPNPEVELSQGRLFVLSSRFEGFPRAVLEAMACGLPVISYDCETGPAEIIRHEVDGLLVPLEDVAALSTAMKRLMQSDDERNRFSERAPEVLERFGMDQFMEKWNAVIDGLSEAEFSQRFEEPIPPN